MRLGLGLTERTVSLHKPSVFVHSFYKLMMKYKKFTAALMCIVMYASTTFARLDLDLWKYRAALLSVIPIPMECLGLGFQFLLESLFP